MSNVMLHVLSAVNVLADVPDTPLPAKTSSRVLLWAIVAGLICVAVVVGIFLVVKARDKKDPPS